MKKIIAILITSKSYLFAIYIADLLLHIFNKKSTAPQKLWHYTQYVSSKLCTIALFLRHYAMCVEARKL